MWTVFRPSANLTYISACFAETGQFAKIVVYAKRVGYTPDYASLLQHITRLNPDQGAEFAGQLVNDEAGPLVDVERVSLPLAVEHSVSS